MSSTNNNTSYSARSISNGLIAGYSAGICGTVVGHPLDSIKVLLQTNGGVPPPGAQQGQQAPKSSMASSSISGHAITRASSNAAANAMQQSSSAKANASTVAVVPAQQQHNHTGMLSPAIRKRSLRALYAGVTGPLLTTGILQSLNFAIYDSVRRVLYQRQLQSEHHSNHGQADDYLHYDNLSNVAIASFLAGASTSVLTSPMVIVKTKQQIMVWGFRKAIRETYLNGRKDGGKPHMLKGIRNFYTGFGAHFFCDAFGRSLYMFSYELFKRELARTKHTEEYQATQYSNNRISTQNLSVPERMLCAASAGMTCWAFIFPADVIRSKLISRSLSTQSSPTTWDGIALARQMVREQGFKSLYRGITITVARAGPVAAAVLPVYDHVLEWVS